MNNFRSFMNRMGNSSRDTNVIANDMDVDDKGGTILTTSVRTLDTEDEEATIDTTLMDVQEIENIRERDAFMYHSIVQKQRRFNQSLLSDDGDEAAPSPYAPFDRFDAARASATSTSIPREIREIILEGFDEEGEEVPNSNSADDSAGVSIAQLALVPSDQARRPGRQPRRMSQSLAPNRTPSTHRQERRFSQSFAGFTTGVVARQRRVTTECHFSLVVPDPETMNSLIRSSVSSMQMQDLFDDDSDMENDENLIALFG